LVRAATPAPGQGKSHQEAEEALRLIRQQVQAVQSPVSFPIANALFDLHALATASHDLFGG
jgi:hypothetical protein